MTTDFITDAVEIRAYRQEFILHPDSWSGFVNRRMMNWDWVKFEDGVQHQVANVRGIYAFVVEPDLANIFQSGYPLYVGETGNANGARTLRIRFGEYLQNKRRIRQRHGVHLMLNLWPENMYFYFCPIADARADLKRIEESINDALLPPFSVGDFSAEVRPMVRAVRL